MSNFIFEQIPNTAQGKVNSWDFPPKIRSLIENLKKEPLLVRGTTMGWVVAGRFMETAKRTRKLIKKSGNRTTRK